MDHFYNNSMPPFNAERFYFSASAQTRVVVAVSACLIGEPVRYDGAARLSDAIEWLADALQLISICPEVGAGLSVPRPPVQLVANNATDARRALGRDDNNLDVTTALQQFARASSKQFDNHAMLCGYLLKSRSPSCGLGSTPLFDNSGVQIAMVSGIQATHFQTSKPWLSYAEEVDLIDRESALAFVVRCRLVFDYLYAGDCDLFAQHRHYRFLIEQLTDETQNALDRLARAQQKFDYLSVLQNGCMRLQPEALLELFII